ncbi:META domain-containing protein [Winogradskyella thalassocola]|nr:META domain-containing protein [Winogradskyella thalassocola]
MKFLLSLFTLLITISSCKSSTDVVENSKNMQETLSGTYYITQLEGTNVISNKLVITFDETSNNVNGTAGCNSFFGSYSTENNTITFGDIAASKRLCPKDIMTIEKQFLKSLSLINSFSIDTNVISFLQNDKILISGTRIAPIKKKSITNDTYKTAVKYQASTRGSFDFILIAKQKMSISEDQSLQNIKNYTIDTTEWEELKRLIDAADLEGLSELIPPSHNHQHDGAAHATLSLQIGDLEYMTPTFDHGNPPKAIEALVNKVLSIKENTIKQ